MFVTFEVSKEGTEVREEQELNIYDMFVTFEVSKEGTEVREEQ